jgi:NAD(P)-dependent dehydrogenase (short-subunit alcohol dehydrogenase family)
MTSGNHPYYCLITGASRGLGVVLAQSFAEAGYNLLLVARNAQRLRQTAESLPCRSGRTIRTLAIDLAEEDAPQRIIDWARQQTPQLHVVIHNAAVQGPIGLLWENDWTAWKHCLAVNLVAPVALSRLAIPWMQEQQVAGRILYLSGGGAASPRPHFTAYATAKAALVRFSETLAAEVQQYGITVNAIAPGPMATSMLAAIVAAGDNAGKREQALAEKIFRDGGTEMARIAALCLGLCRDEAQHITGRLISAPWDPWEDMASLSDKLKDNDIYTLRRIVPKDRGFDWGEA